MDPAASADDEINTVDVDGLNLAGVTGSRGHGMHVGHAKLLLLLILGHVEFSITLFRISPPRRRIVSLVECTGVSFEEVQPQVAFAFSPASREPRIGSAQAHG